MLKLTKIAVTGSLCSGKSTVCRFFEEWGAYVVSADQLLHEAFSADLPLRQRIRDLFGESVFEGELLIRSRVAESVANDQKLLTRLEEICHPYVKKELERHFHKAQKAGKASLFVAEVPLLFESNVPFSSWFDTIVTVVGDRQKNKERYIRAGGTAEQFDFRNNRQMSAQEKMQRAHYTLVNNGTVEELKVEAKKLFSIFTNKSP